MTKQGLTQVAKRLILEGSLKVTEVMEVSEEEWPEPVAGRLHYDSIDINPDGGLLIVHFRQNGVPIYKVEVVQNGGSVTITDLDGHLEVTLRDD